MRNLTLLFCLISYALIGQTDNSYLQAPTSHSIWVNWLTYTGTESVVEYGLTQGNLNQTVTGNSLFLSDAEESWNWHKVHLTNLTPNTAYYYRVKTGNDISPIKRFKTQPVEGTSTGHYKFLIIGDHQARGDRYDILVKAARKKAEEKWGTPFEDHTRLIVNLGDQVDQGFRLRDWRIVHFGIGAEITGNVPSVTVVGNHDREGPYGAETDFGGDIGVYSQIFSYNDDNDFNYKGLKGNRGDNFYAFQVANIVFVCMNSLARWSDQTNWVQQIVNEVDKDNSVQWLFSDAHHPLWAEQLPGDASSYMKDDILPVLKQTDKMAMYLSGHAHLYARGAMKEEPIYHVINGGASWDQYWTQKTSQMDYEETQKTIIRQVYQLVDMDLDNREMHVESYSTGSTYGAFREDLLIDEYYLKLDANKPNKPTINIPNSVSLPYDFKGSLYSGDEPYNSVEFQFTGPSGNFNNYTYRLKRDFENIYYNGKGTQESHWEITNLNAGLDIFTATVDANKLHFGKNYAKVRYRDKSMHWSDWSDPIEFSTTNGNLGKPAENDPIAWFPFEGNILDMSTKGKDFDNATNSGATFYNDPTLGNCMSFGGSDMITIQQGAEAHDGLPKQEEITVSAWVKANSADNFGGFFGLIFDTGDNESGWLLGTRGQKFSFAMVASSQNINYLTAPSNFNLGQWYHVAATYNGTRTKLFIDGQEVADNGVNSGKIHYNNAGWFQIGSYKDDDEDNRHDGYLDDIAMWERALTAEEIENVYNGQVLSSKKVERNEVNIFPNPATTELTIETQEASTISIYDVTGNLIQSRKIFGKSTFNTSKLAKGTYLVNVKGITSDVTKVIIVK